MTRQIARWVDSEGYTPGFLLKSDGVGRAEWGGQRFIWQIHKTAKNGGNTISSGTFFDCYGGVYLTGSYSGFANTCTPLLPPFKMKLTKVRVAFRSASFNWLSTAGGLLLDLGLFHMAYNSGSVDTEYRLSLEGSFSGNSTSNGTWFFDCDSFTMITGTNSIDKDNHIGAIFRMSGSDAGQIYSLVDPVLQLHFEEIL